MSSMPLQVWGLNEDGLSYKNQKGIRIRIRMGRETGRHLKFESCGSCVEHAVNFRAPVSKQKSCKWKNPLQVRQSCWSLCWGRWGQEIHYLQEVFSWWLPYWALEVRIFNHKTRTVSSSRDTCCTGQTEGIQANPTYIEERAKFLERRRILVWSGAYLYQSHRVFYKCPVLGSGMWAEHYKRRVKTVTRVYLRFMIMMRWKLNFVPVHSLKLKKASQFEEDRAGRSLYMSFKAVSVEQVEAVAMDAFVRRGR